uniref:RE1-silencing transcription factor n=1 Tax=Chinchilla lanigera TaxID=34839 RepID=A0A8C2V1Y9_CHILA
MATQVMGQASGGAGLFPSSGNMGMALPNDMYDLHDLSKAEAALASGPASASESQEIDEDEGIHSHDGSDLSDNMSEGSDDSGLHGARPVPQEAGAKSAKEAPAVQGAEGDFVCIFCDRSFRKEKDYSKHLNRHLVNVYFLEKAAKGQE